MERPSHHALPKIPPAVAMDIHELLDVTVQLKDILARETEQLKQMKVKEMGLLQQEQLRMTNLLQTYQDMLAANPSILGDLDEDTRE